MLITSQLVDSNVRSGVDWKLRKISQSNYWIIIMANGWTDERRARQAALIQSWKPWTRSTGARTPEGKAASSRNAHRFTHRKAALLAHWLLQQTKALRDGQPFASDDECRRRFKHCYLKELD